MSLGRERPPPPHAHMSGRRGARRWARADVARAAPTGWARGRPRLPPPNALPGQNVGARRLRIRDRGLNGLRSASWARLRGLGDAGGGRAGARIWRRGERGGGIARPMKGRERTSVAAWARTQTDARRKARAGATPDAPTRCWSIAIERRKEKGGEAGGRRCCVAEVDVGRTSTLRSLRKGRMGRCRRELLCLEGGGSR